jgi:hypothetical protein
MTSNIITIGLILLLGFTGTWVKSISNTHKKRTDYNEDLENRKDYDEE